MPATSDFDDLQAGHAFPPETVVTAVSRMDWVQYAGASGDFNPMHSDEAAAKAAGLPSVFGHGMFTAGVLATALTRRFGVGSLRRLKVRFAKQVWPEEAMICAVTVTKVHDDGGERRAELTCTMKNAAGELQIAGEATVSLSARAGA